MNEKEVIEWLKTDENYEDFHEEFHGKFFLRYTINGVNIIFDNAVGGYVEAWLLMPSDFKKVNKEVKDFIKIARKILQQRINSSSNM